MLIQFSKPIPQTKAAISAVEVFAIIDKPSAKVVSAEVSIENVGSRTLTLWEGEAYDAIGEWKDADVSARVTELVTGLFK